MALSTFLRSTAACSILINPKKRCAVCLEVGIRPCKWMANTPPFETSSLT